MRSPVQDEFAKEMRAYNLRLCEWLGLDPESVFSLDENKTGATGPLDPPGLRVSWTATERQTASRGFNDHWSITGGSDQPTIYEGRVVLDFVELREMRASVGERPGEDLRAIAHGLDRPAATVKIPESWPRRSREERVRDCEHEWELRPESDTWICIFCADER